MYTKTIYILNNTILECFDIAFKETNKQKEEQNLVLCEFIKEEQTATCS